MISTQPGSTPLASFKILSLEETESHGSYCSGNDIGETAIRRTEEIGITDGEKDEEKIDAFRKVAEGTLERPFYYHSDHYCASVY